MKGIILAGGAGTRLYPATLAISKQLIPVYDKPMIYYPLSTLMLAGIKDILIISTPEDLPRFKTLLGYGNHLGISLSYAKQSKPEGLAQAFIIGENFINQEPVALILGDNLFHGSGFTGIIQQASKLSSGALIFGYYVKDPQRYGVVEFNENQVISIEEKPITPKSHYAVPGLYFYDSNVSAFARSLRPSQRNELEITDLNLKYLEHQSLKVEVLGRGIAWLDTGTHESLLEASNFISIIEKRQGFKVGCIEEIAYNMKFIDKEQLLKLATNLKSSYGQYLINLV